LKAENSLSVSDKKTIILGGGVTGLASGLASGLAVYEMAEAPGGICASYYVAPGSRERLYSAPRDHEAYRFEIGGGHWIWGGDPLVLRFIQSLTTFKSYARSAAVYLSDQATRIPYPIQNHLSYLGSAIARQVLCEMLEAKADNRPTTTMGDWMRACFGPTLCPIFFDPFHQLYAVGLWQELAPQDQSNSPVNLSMAVHGALSSSPQPAGYNTSFQYPVEGLNVLAQCMAERCNIHYGQRVTRLCVNEKLVEFADGREIPYQALLCTLPLDKTLQLAGLTVNHKSDPYTSVMVLNLGARKGPRCPTEQWLYIPRSKAGFHRVGFYSHVDPSFLPLSTRQNGDRTSIYVEKAYMGGKRPTQEQTEALITAVVQELQDWCWIEDVEVADPTWVETAYTWVWPNSPWRQEAMRILQEHDIYQVGRYGRWAAKLTDQGISQSIRDGLYAGASFRECT